MRKVCATSHDKAVFRAFDRRFAFIRQDTSDCRGRLFRRLDHRTDGFREAVRTVTQWRPLDEFRRTFIPSHLCLSRYDRHSGEWKMGMSDMGLQRDWDNGLMRRPRNQRKRACRQGRPPLPCLRNGEWNTGMSDIGRRQDGYNGLMHHHRKRTCRRQGRPPLSCLRHVLEELVWSRTSPDRLLWDDGVTGILGPLRMIGNSRHLRHLRRNAGAHGNLRKRCTDSANRT